MRGVVIWARPKSSRNVGVENDDAGTLLAGGVQIPVVRAHLESLDSRWSRSLIFLDCSRKYGKLGLLNSVANAAARFDAATASFHSPAFA
jgi:hypothetical protein